MNTYNDGDTVAILLEDGQEALFQVAANGEGSTTYIGQVTCYEPLRYFSGYIEKSTNYVFDIYGAFCGKVKDVAQATCTCGGYTIYKSYEKLFHTTYCKVHDG